MKRTVINLIVMLSLLLHACGGSGKEPTQDEIVGSWKSSDGASFEFKNDGTFIGISLPAEYFTFYTSQSKVPGERINGIGKWQLQTGNGSFNKISLIFRKIDDKNMYGSYQILVSGENGVLENQPPWYLFVWKEEEGGERYKFAKK